MSDITGGPAFPTMSMNEAMVDKHGVITRFQQPGLTVLDYFAGQIISAMVNETGMTLDTFADEAYNLAAKMVEARKKYGIQ